MPGRIVAAIAATLLSLSGGNAFAQETPVPPDGGGSSGSTGSGIAAAGLVQEGQRIVTDGQEARVLVPAKTSTLELTFVNQGDAPVRGAVARAFPVEGARLASTESVMGDVAPGASAVARFDVTIDAASCTDFFGLGGEIFADDSGREAVGYFKAGFPVACPGARLSIESMTVGGGDGDHAIEPGEAVTLTVVLRNDGADPATGVTGAMTLRGEGVEVVVGSARWPDIAPGASAASLTPFTIRVASDAKVQESCPGPEPRPIPGGIEPGAPGSSEPGGAGDTPVSSDADGIASSDGAVAPDETVSSDGASSSGGTGSAEPSPATDLPLPAPDGSEPAPMPMPADRPGGKQIPPVYQEDPGVAFDALFEVITANDERFGLEYSTRIVCASADGTNDGAPALARDDAAAGLADKTGAASPGPAFPITASILTIAAGLGARRALALRKVRAR